jgi:hypothetical protein
MTTTAVRTTAVDRLLAAVERGDGVGADVYTDDATFDATVPRRRFPLRGAEAIREQLSEWFDNPSTLEELERLPVPGGEVVRFLSAFVSDGVPTTVHQLHVLRLDGDRIAAHTAFCGGRWPAALVAEMTAARA